MKNIKIIAVLFIMAACAIINNDGRQLNAKVVSKDKITAKHVERHKKDDIFGLKIFTIHFSGIIYDVNSKQIRIPIFRGNMGDVYYSDLLDYFHNVPSPYYFGNLETGFLIPCKQGEMKKTFHEFLAFYKSNILKDVDIEHPITIYLSPVEWIIQYNFVVDGVPCYMHINFESRKEDAGKPLPKSVYDIVPNEQAGNPGIFYAFYRGRSVPEPAK